MLKRFSFCLTVLLLCGALCGCMALSPTPTAELPQTGEPTQTAELPQTAEPTPTAEPPAETAAPQPTQAAGISWRETDLCAAGYAVTMLEFDQALFEQGKAVYAELTSEMEPAFINAGGCELYLVVPRYADSRVTLHSFNIDTLGPDELLYEGTGPLWVLMNVSDIFPSAVITVEHGGQSVSFSPSISLRGDDGLLNPFPEGAQDITPPTLRG